MTHDCTTRYRVVVRFPLLLLITWLTVALFGSCRAPSTGSPPRDSGGCTPTVASSSVTSAPPSSSAALSSSAPALPYELERGCADDLDDGKSSDAQLEQMGASCVRGFTRMNDVALTRSDDGEQVATVKLEAYACVRIGVASDARGGAVEARLTGHDATELVRVTGRTPMLVGRDGPVCVHDAGDYRLAVRPLGMAGLQVAVWVAGR